MLIMAVALRSSTFTTTRPTTERHARLAPVRVVVIGVVSALTLLAAASGAWIGLAVVSGLFLFGTSLLASGDEPLSVRQALSIGTVHLVAGLLIAL
jgi:hypothetical protein